MSRRDHLGARRFVERNEIKVFAVPADKGVLMIGALAAEIAKRRLAWEHQEQPTQIPEKLLLRFLDVGQVSQYTLEQSHGSPPCRLYGPIQP
jgi:hypothetical protein